MSNEEYNYSVDAEFEVTKPALVTETTVDNYGFPTGLKLSDGKILVPIVAFQDITTREVYWKDSDLERIAGIEVYNVNYSIYSKNLEEEKEEED